MYTCRRRQDILWETNSQVFILHKRFPPSFVYGRFVILICAVFFSPPVDPVDTESTKMDSSFSLVGLSSSPKKRIRVECRCGSDSCRKYLF